MKRALLLASSLLFVFLLSSTALWAQERNVTGQVTSTEDGEALPAVNVLIKGTTTGTVTDIDGNYNLAIPGDDVILVFSFIGYTSQEVTVGTQSTINVSLAVDVTELSEVVVVGYGTQQRRDILGAIGSADSDVLENIPVADPLEALQGRVAGVNITSGSGRPGQRAIVRVRGVASIGGVGSTDPLYVVDGVPMTNRDDGQLPEGQGVSPLSRINPDDIQSIEVLKDAAAAAIYGSRASNGVVLITTKKGDFNQDTQIDATFYYGIQSPSNQLDFLNASQFREIMRESRAAAGLAPDPQFDEDPSIVTTDWLEEIQRDNPLIENYQVSASGGSDNTRFFVSGNYFNQESILTKGGFERISARLNLENRSANDKLNIGLNLQGSRSDAIITTRDNSIFSAWPQALQARPDEPVFNEDGTFALITANNPVQMFEQDDQQETFAVVGNAFAQYEVIPGLKLRMAIGTDVTWVKDFSFAPTTHPSGAGVGGTGTSATALRSKWVSENTITYTNNSLVDERLSLTALAGFTFEEEELESNLVSGQGFPSDNLRYLNSASTNTAFSSAQTKNRLESLIGRVNVEFDDKYLLQAAVRRDGSSKFGANDRYGVFPSFSFGWRISGESFMDGITWLDDLKLRASWGQVGNDRSIGNFTSLAQIGSGENYNNLPGLAVTRIANPDLTWETTEQTNIGLDVAVFSGRINASIDYYIKDTEDLLLARPIPSTSGLRSIQENVGSVENKGVEISITSVNIDRAVRWTTTLNVASNDNEVTKLNNDEPIDVGFVSRTAVGQPIGAFYVIKSLGVDPNTGDMMYEDVNGDGIIGGDDRQFLGSYIPKWEGGLTNTLSWNGFDFTFFFQFASDVDVYSLAQEGIGGFWNLGATEAGVAMTTDVLRRWQNPGDITDMPRAIAGPQGVENNRRSSRFLDDASYIRLKNITLGYTLPESLIGRIGIRSIRVYVTGQNLWTITDYNGFDPEVSSSNDTRQGGVDSGAIPQLKNVTFGINIGL